MPDARPSLTTPRPLPGPDTGAGRAGVVVLGHQALGRLGSRVGLLYLGSAALALLIGGSTAAASESGRRGIPAALLAIALVGGCGVLLNRATSPQADPLLRLVGVGAGAIASAGVATVAGHLHWYGAAYVASVTATAGGTALGLAAGGWGAVACLASLSAMALALVEAGRPLAVPSFAGATVSTCVAMSVYAALRRSFAETERTLAGADAAALAHEVSRERWRTRRRTDRQLHDTVLTTLNLLTHPEFGTPDDLLRDLARRDRDLLEAGDAPLPAPGPPSATTDEATTGRATTGKATTDEAPADDLTALSADWGRAGLAVHLHGVGWCAAVAGLRADVAGALKDALRECLRNVHRHAGVDEANVVVMRETGVVSVLVVDAGRGFDTAAVDPDRLGLAESVRARMAEVDGDAVLWSAPGEGTSVLLSVPAPGAVVPA
jgi:signal transduction histidine kinase